MTAAWGLTNRPSANVCRRPPVHKPRNTPLICKCVVKGRIANALSKRI